MTKQGPEAAGSLLERDAPLEAGHAALDSAGAGAGALVAFTGPVGIGRSALLSAFGAKAVETGTVSLHARCSEAEEGLAFGTVLHLFEQYVADLDEDVVEAIFAGRAGLATPLLTGEGLRDPGALLREVPGASLALTHALYRVTANMASRNPVVLMIDDLQWSDPESLQFLLYLAPRLAEISASVIVTVRDGSGNDSVEAVSELIGAGNAHVERLAPLGQQSVRELVRKGTGACSPQSGEACHWLTGGNPMLVYELIAAAKESGLRLDGASAAEICAGAPDRVRHRVLGPMGGMPEDEVAVAKASAVLGSSVNRRQVAAMTELEDDSLSSAVDSLESAGILDPGRPFDYIHPLLRAAVYSQIPREERAQLHARAATVLRAHGNDSPNAVATHLMRTRPAAQPWVVEELVRAAGAAHSNGELDRAVLYLGRALNEPPTKGGQAEVLLDLGRVEIDRGEIAPAVAMLTRAAEIAREPRCSAIAIELARAHCLAGDPGEAAALVDRAIERNHVDEAQHDELEATWLAAALIDPALRPEAERRIERMNGIDAHRDAPTLLATVASHMALTGGSRERVIALATTALASHTDKAAPAAWGPALQALCWAGEPELASSIAAELSTRPSVQNSRRALATIRLAQAHSSHLLGHLDEAESEARAACALVDSGGRAEYLDCPQARLVEIQLERGDVEDAEAALDAATAAPYALDSLLQAQVLAARARMHAVHHRTAEAFADATEAGRLLIAGGIENPTVSSWRSQAAVASATLGDPDQAHELISIELELARRFGAAPAIGIALTAAGAIASGQKAVELLVEAEQVLENSDAQLEYARALTYLGAALRHHGSRKKAQVTLKKALEVATSLNAERIALLVRSELQMAGSRPRADATSGSAALTAAEQRVTALAADGLTNREIAQELFVTMKTVEFHLRNAFRKLDVSSRAELAAALGSDAELVAAG